MPELKHGFGAAKMNKDADERIVPNGEYRDALNIEIVTSENSDAGAMQTLLGNENITNSQITATISSNARCVGSVVDEQNNNLYYFVADPDNFTDYIFQYNSDADELIPVVVDKYQINTNILVSQFNTSPTNAITNIIIDPFNVSGSLANLTNVRPGMAVSGNFFKIIPHPSGLPGTISQPFVPTYDDGVIVIEMREYADPINTNIVGWQLFLDDTIVNHNIFIGGITSAAGNFVSFRADRVLNFDKNRLINSADVIDGILFWTDGITEPKKIIIRNLIEGTHVSGELHSYFPVYDNYGVLLQNSSNVIDFRAQPERLKEEHVTVIKKSPLYPPTILMSNTSDGRINASGVSNLRSNINNEIFTDTEGANLPVGTIKNVIFNANVDYVQGDILLLRKTDWDLNDDQSDYEIMVELIDFNANSNPQTGQVKILFIQNNIVNEVTTNASGLDSPTPTTFYSMLKQERPLYEFKLPRFAYRYKYQDNQYSAYSPFSEPAFLPGDFLYNPKEGYNLGMVNTLRSVYIMDFVTDEDAIPKDVVEIDILYKESNSTNIYTVKTIKYGDDEWVAKGSVLNTLASNYARTTGRVHITSEMVRAAVSSNQLLRPWDNVPKAALTQSVVGNRIVYANYLQNYNL